jgi:hypothetical protein
VNLGNAGVNPPYSIAEGNGVADPNPFAFRSGDLVSDPLADDFPFELGEGEQDIEGEPAHARGRVEGLRDRDGETPCSSMAENAGHGNLRLSYKIESGTPSKKANACWHSIQTSAKERFSLIPLPPDPIRPFRRAWSLEQKRKQHGIPSLA